MEEEVLESLKGKKIIFCLPGGPFSGDFLVNFYGLTSRLLCAQVNTSIAHLTGSCIHRLRNQVGGGRPEGGLFQRPFDVFGEEYDYIMWIDSDIMFTLKDFTNLVVLDKDVATGWYSQKNKLPACGFTQKTKDKYDQKTPPFPLYDRHNVYRFFNDNDIESKTDPYVIDWVGMGWFLIKAGVVDNVKYPWFTPLTVRVGKTEAGEHLYDSLSEDLSFQIALKNAGYDIWLDPTIRVGHEKTQVL